MEKVVLEKLQYKYEQTGKVLHKLAISIKDFTEIDIWLTKENERYETVYEELRDSVIKRIELSNELLWKYIRLYLQHFEKMNAASPRSTFRMSLEAQLLTEQEVETCLEILDCRNNAAHIYREEMAEQLAKDAPSYLNVMRTIYIKIKPHNDE